MKHLSEFRNEVMYLVQPSQLKRECELHSSEGIILRANFVNWRKSDVTVEGLGGKWVIRKPSIWKSKIEVSKDGFNYPIGTYTEKIFSNERTIQLQRGLRLPYKSKLLKGLYTIYSDTNEILIQIKQSGVLKRKTELTLGKRKLEIVDEYPWLPMLVWYIIIQNQRQTIGGVHYS